MHLRQDLILLLRPRRALQLNGGIYLGKDRIEIIQNKTLRRRKKSSCLTNTSYGERSTYQR